MNQESDVAFRAGITSSIFVPPGGPVSPDSGYFRRLQNGAFAGTLQPVVVQGQQVPGGGTFNTIPLPGNQGAEFALGVNGDLAFVNSFTDAAGAERGLFLARPDGTLVRVLATGDTVPGGGVLSEIRMSQDLAVGGAGTFAIWAEISGGNSGEAIYATAVPLGIASTTVTLTSPLNSSISGQQITLTATVSSTAPGTPSGNVNFFDNGASLGNGTLDSTGKAALTTSSMAGGPHSLVAQYDGDVNFAPANSPTVTAFLTGFAPPPTGLAVTAGQSLPIPLTLYAAPGSNLIFTLSCSGLPAGASCVFDQNPVTPGPSGTAIKVTLSTMRNSNSLPDLPRKGPGLLGLLELSAILSALLAMAMIKLRQAPRRRLAFGMCLAAFGLMALMAGCGVVGSGSSPGPGSSGTPPGPAAITVTGTSSATTVSTVVNVAVQ
jgi:Big-like domain-containing protein